MSVDALCALPSDLPNVDTASTILTGSSDGYVRAVQILPTKLLGVVADHGEWPIERISIGSGQQSISIDQPEAGPRGTKVRSEDNETSDAQHQKRWWVGSVGHEDVLRMTDLEGFFRDNEGNEEGGGKGALGVDVSGEDSDFDDSDMEEDEDAVSDSKKEKVADEEEENQDEDESEDEEKDKNSYGDSGDESDVPQRKKRKRKTEPESVIAPKKPKSKSTVVAEPSFFDDL